jgi:hypothetical protein
MDLEPVFKKSKWSLMEENERKQNIEKGLIMFKCTKCSGDLYLKQKPEFPQEARNPNDYYLGHADTSRCMVLDILFKELIWDGDVCTDNRINPIVKFTDLSFSEESRLTCVIPQELWPVIMKNVLDYDTINNLRLVCKKLFRFVNEALVDIVFHYEENRFDKYQLRKMTTRDLRVISWIHSLDKSYRDIFWSIKDGNALLMHLESEFSTNSLWNCILSPEKRRESTVVDLNICSRSNSKQKFVIYATPQSPSKGSPLIRKFYYMLESITLLKLAKMKHLADSKMPFIDTLFVKHLNYTY